MKQQKKPDNVGHKAIILASTSPRRIQMMAWLGVPITVVANDLDESKVRHKSPRTLTRLLAEAKAQSVAENYRNSIVIGSDAVVSFNDMILEKPQDVEHQRQLINMQLGKEAKVYSSVCIIDTSNGQKVIKTKVTPYKIAVPTAQMIEKYIKSGNGLDKAGGFGCQDDDGLFVGSIDGCYTNLLGFPLCDVAEALRDMGINIDMDIKQKVKTMTGMEC